MSQFGSRAYFGVAHPRTPRMPYVLSFAALAGSLLITGAIFLLDGDQPQKQANTPEPGLKQAIEIIVPVHEIPEGTALNPQLFRRVSLPLAILPEKTIRSVEEVHGKFARTILVASMPITEAYLRATPAINEVIAKIPKGYRAVSIRVDDRSSIQGWAEPGAHVDVLWNTNLKGKPALVPLVRNAAILAVERETSPNSGRVAPPSGLTLLVSVDDAKKIDFALTAGTLVVHLLGIDEPYDRGSDEPMTTEKIIKEQTVDQIRPSRVGSLSVNGQKFDVTEDGRIMYPSNGPLSNQQSGLD